MALETTAFYKVGHWALVMGHKNWPVKMGLKLGCVNVQCLGLHYLLLGYKNDEEFWYITIQKYINYIS